MVLAVETNLQKLLEGTKQYQVPLYQRTYSWTKEQLKRLWEDLVKLAEDQPSPGVTSTHFIGSLVLAPSPAVGPAGLQEFLVVDGQQRLTTLTLLLAAIRDHRAENESSRHVERINEKYLINKWETGEPTKLLPTQADRESYLACIHRTPHAGGSDPCGNAYRFFRSRLLDLDDPEDDLDIERMENAVVGGLSLVCITAQHGDNVHRIFESLNNTGLRLTQGDLIRNYLFMRLPKRGEQVYHSLWLPLEKQLNSQQLELLFWLDLVQDNELAKQSDTYSLQEARMDLIHTEDEIEEEVKRFSRLGSLVGVLMNPSTEKDAAVRKRLERLSLWGTTTVYPLLLHLLDRRDRGSATNDDIALAMQYIESFFVRRVVIGRATANVNRILLRAVQEVRDRSPIAEALRDYLSVGRKFFATDNEVREAVKTVAFYWSGKANQKQLVLRWLEEAHLSKEPVDADKLTIEHVMPQTPTDEWRAMLGDGLEAGEDLEAVYEALLHTIGNLTLTGYNSELGNGSFDSKRKRLKKSGIVMNQSIAAQVAWGRAEILDRAARLADTIIDTWPGPNRSTQETAVLATWKVLSQVLAAVPAGSWTTYGDVATAVGTHPVPLGQRLANVPVANAYRVLGAGGVVAANFKWLEEGKSASAREVLEAEGVEFDGAGRANPNQRLTAEDLMVLAGLDPESAAEPIHVEASDERHKQFIQLLSSSHTGEVVAGVAITLSTWLHLGGQLNYGRGDDTSCFLMVDGSSGNQQPWPAAIYPLAGKVEIVFQHMSSRPPFDSIELREEFRRRLSAVEGIDLPEAKIELRPGFPVEILAIESKRDAVIGALAWFFEKVRERTAD